jgi:hypothetical protein
MRQCEYLFSEKIATAFMKSIFVQMLIFKVVSLWSRLLENVSLPSVTIQEQLLKVGAPCNIITDLTKAGGTHSHHLLEDHEENTMKQESN